MIKLLNTQVWLSDSAGCLSGWLAPGLGVPIKCRDSRIASITDKVPEYAKEAKSGDDFRYTEDADLRSGSNIKSIKLGGSEFIIDAAANDVNVDHRKTGCVRFLRRDKNAFHFANEKIGGLQATGDALTSGT